MSLRPREYFIWLLVLETSVAGVFLSLDLIQFFLFWELELVPMYLLISIWGSGRKEYSAMKFLLYTIGGSALMLVGFLLLGLKAGTFEIEALTAKLRSAETLIVADYRGLTMPQVDALRGRLLEHGATFTVVKNTLTRRAARDAGADALLLEVHPDPEHALSDGYQTLNLKQFAETMQACRKVAEAVGRSM